MLPFVDEDSHEYHVSGTLSFGGAQYGKWLDRWQEGSYQFNEEYADGYSITLADKCKQELADLPDGWPKMVAKELNSANCCAADQYSIRLVGEDVGPQAAFFVIQVIAAGRSWRGVTVPIGDVATSGVKPPRGVSSAGYAGAAPTTACALAAVAVSAPSLLRGF